MERRDFDESDDESETHERLMTPEEAKEFIQSVESGTTESCRKFIREYNRSFESKSETASIPDEKDDIQEESSDISSESLEIDDSSKEMEKKRQSINEIKPDARDESDEQLQNGTKELREDNETQDESEQSQDVEDSSDSKSHFSYKDLDPDEVYRLYYKEDYTHDMLAEHFGFKTRMPIHKFFKMMEWETRTKGFEEIDSDEVHRLYYEEEYPIKRIVEELGYKSESTLKNFFTKMEWELRPPGFQKIEIHPDDVYRLYFDEGLHMTEMIEYFECKSSTPILRVMEENGWKSKYQESLDIIENIDPQEVYRLYYEEGYSHRKIGEYYGVSFGPIRRIFEENGWEYNQKVEIEHDEFCRLYYEEALLLRDIAEIFEITEKQAKDYRKKYLEKRENESLSDLRARLFGTECVSCGRPRKEIHRKDGTPHDGNVLKTKKRLRKLDPNEWVALCWHCHRLAHALMDSFGCEWNDIEKIVRELRIKYLS